MRFNEAWRAIPSLLLVAVAGACARQPAARQYGTVEIPLTGANSAGTPYRLHGELTFSGVDTGVVGSASTRTAGTSEVLEVPLPAGRYTLTLNAEFVVESLGPCPPTPTGNRLAWVSSAKPPLIGVTDGRVTRVRFNLVPTDPPRSRAGRESESPSERTRQFRSTRTCSSSGSHAAEAESALTTS
jgi:hypothetical protein